MSVTTFEKILQDAYKKGITSPKKASDWLWNSAISRLGNVTGSKLIGENPDNVFSSMSSELIGRMVFYQYQAKTATDLPYWDKFPIIFVVDMTSDGYYGLNLHYLAPLHRVQLMDALYSTANNKKFDDSTKLKISYQILKNASRFKSFKPCFKRYLNSHVRSKFLYISPEEWAIAALIPTARFQKARDTTVWNDSNNIINGKNVKNHNQSLPKGSINKRAAPVKPRSNTTKPIRPIK